MALKKALIITYEWPPKGGVGVMRVMKFAKYLSGFGWEPVILTTDESAPGTPYRGEDAGIDMTSIRVVRAGYKEALSFLPFRAREHLLQPDTKRGWYGPAVDAGRKLFEREPADIIFSTSPPETCHMIARRLKKEFGVPWVADLRDLWSTCHFTRDSAVKRWPACFMERMILRDADISVTVSEGWAGDLAASSTLPRERIEVITNGYDESDFTDIPFKATPGGKFTITYTGKLHEGRQDPAAFFEALRDCIKEGLIDRTRIELKFYVMGFRKADIRTLADSYGLTDVVKEYAPVGHREILAIQRASTALLFFQWHGAPGWYSAKIFEYLGSRRPILAVTEKGSAVNRLIEELGAGIAACSKTELKKALAKWYGEYLAKGSIECRMDEELLKRYTRKEETRKLAGIFDQLVKGR